jgi:hypothetical protein
MGLSRFFIRSYSAQISSTAHAAKDMRCSRVKGHSLGREHLAQIIRNTTDVTLVIDIQVLCESGAQH